MALVGGSMAQRHGATPSQKRLGRTLRLCTQILFSTVWYWHVYNTTKFSVFKNLEKNTTNIQRMQAPDQPSEVWLRLEFCVDLDLTLLGVSCLLEYSAGDRLSPLRKLSPFFRFSILVSSFGWIPVVHNLVPGFATGFSTTDSILPSFMWAMICRFA